MKKLNKILYLIIVLSFLAIILPIIFLQFDYIKTLALKTFHTRENAYGYLQFVGSFLGVVATIAVTIILQEKQKYQKEQDENKKAILNLYTQLDRAFKKYKEAQNNNRTKAEDYFVAFGPREIFIDPSYVKDLAQLKPKLDDELYEDIGLGFDAMINLYKYYLGLEQQLDSTLKKDFSNSTILNRESPGNLRQAEIRRNNREIVDHVNFMCDLYDKKYKEVLRKLRNEF